MRRFDLAVLAVALASPSAASAQDQVTAPPTPAVTMDLAAANAIRAMLGSDFDDGHVAMLHALGHQKAVVASCPGFAIDEGRFASEMDLIYDDRQGRPRTLTAEQRVALERSATLAFGTALGAQIAIAAHDQQGFCQAAEAERSAGKVQHLVWAK